MEKNEGDFDGHNIVGKFSPVRGRNITRKHHMLIQ